MVCTKRCVEFFNVEISQLTNSLAGNYYSITNDYDKPARIFFSQGCEVTSQPTDGEQSQMSVMA